MINQLLYVAILFLLIGCNKNKDCCDYYSNSAFLTLTYKDVEGNELLGATDSSVYKFEEFKHYFLDSLGIKRSVKSLISYSDDFSPENIGFDGNSIMTVFSVFTIVKMDIKN